MLPSRPPVKGKILGCRVRGDAWCCERGCECLMRRRVFGKIYVNWAKTEDVVVKDDKTLTSNPQTQRREMVRKRKPLNPDPQTQNSRPWTPHPNLQPSNPASGDGSDASVCLLLPSRPPAKGKILGCRVRGDAWCCERGCVCLMRRRVFGKIYVN